MTRFVQFTTIHGKRIFINPDQVSIVTDGLYPYRIDGKEVFTTMIHMAGDQIDDCYYVQFNTVEVIERLRGDL